MRHGIKGYATLGRKYSESKQSQTRKECEAPPES